MKVEPRKESENRSENGDGDDNGQIDGDDGNIRDGMLQYNLSQKKIYEGCLTWDNSGKLVWKKSYCESGSG